MQENAQSQSHVMNLKINEYFYLLHCCFQSPFHKRNKNNDFLKDKECVQNGAGADAESEVLLSL